MEKIWDGCTEEQLLAGIRSEHPRATLEPLARGRPPETGLVMAFIDYPGRECGIGTVMPPDDGKPRHISVSGYGIRYVCELDGRPHLPDGVREVWYVDLDPLTADRLDEVWS